MQCPFLRKSLWSSSPTTSNGWGCWLFMGSMELVEDGLKKPQGGGPPGLDSVSATVLKAFAPVMTPHIHESIQSFLAAGQIPQSWTNGVLTHIPCHW